MKAWEEPEKQKIFAVAHRTLELLFGIKLKKTYFAD